MSQKNTKKSKKRAEEESNTMASQSEEVQKKEKDKATTNGDHGPSDAEDSELKGFTAEEVITEDKTNGSVNEPDKKEEATTSDPPQNETVPTSENAQPENTPETNESENKVQTQNEEETQTKKLNESQESESIEMEPLALDLEEPDPELEFDESSDIESVKGSPVLNRCKTRRSQTRNIPTPKTPKSILDQNGDDKIVEEDKKSEVSVSAVTTSEVADNDLEDIVTGAANSSEVGSTNSEKTESDSMSNLSTRAVAGGDLTTRDFDLSYNDANAFANKPEPLVNPFKDRTFPETLRGLTSRRSIRAVHDYRKYAIKTNMEKVNCTNENISLAPRSSVERLSGVKRKNQSESPERAKRSKEDSPGLLSRFASPIGHIKSRFSTRSEVSSSTPKLTGFKSKTDIFDNVDVSNIIEDNKKESESNKWCNIM